MQGYYKHLQFVLCDVHNVYSQFAGMPKSRRFKVRFTRGCRRRKWLDRNLTIGNRANW